MAPSLGQFRPPACAMHLIPILEAVMDGIAGLTHVADRKKLLLAAR
jgi:hypothetical protein